jgi:hypothetical protein
MVHPEIMEVYEGAETKSNKHKDHSADALLLPGENEKGKQDKGWDKMDKKRAELLPDRMFRIEGIQGEQAYKKDGQDTEYPWGPVQDSCTCLHFEGIGFSLKGTSYDGRVRDAREVEPILSVFLHR